MFWFVCFDCLFWGVCLVFRCVDALVWFVLNVGCISFRHGVRVLLVLLALVEWVWVLLGLNFGCLVSSLVCFAFDYSWL